MKIWRAYSSEHSMNLVMIGHFTEAKDSAKAMEDIEQITALIDSEVEKGQRKIGQPLSRYTNEMLDLLTKLNISNIGPDELEQFAYEIKVKVDENQIIITTDEIEVSAFLKVLVDNGARVEVYSAHDYPGTAYGRGK